jgi:hypothetical protein
MRRSTYLSLLESACVGAPCFLILALDMKDQPTTSEKRERQVRQIDIETLPVARKGKVVETESHSARDMHSGQDFGQAFII